MSDLTKLHDPKSGQMRVAALISGSGSNLINILEHEKKLEQERGKPPFHIAAIFADNYTSNGKNIAEQYGLPFMMHDLAHFCEIRNVSIKDMTARAEFETSSLDFFKYHGCTIGAYAGYMRRATEVFIGAFLGVNVHPADLTITREDGRRKYTGDNAVRDAILAGEKQIRSTTHLVIPQVDAGPILMISKPVNIVQPFIGDVKQTASEYQNKLKEEGDWKIFPQTLEYIADGKFAKDANGVLYFNNIPVPNGLKLER